jgi:hypothetical protein
MFHRRTTHLELCCRDASPESEGRARRARESRVTAVCLRRQWKLERKLLISSGLCSMRTRGDTRVKRYTCGSKLLNAGLVGETRFFKDKDLTLVILSNWPPVIRNCGLYVLSRVIIPAKLNANTCDRNLQPSQMILSTLICDLQTIKWGAGRTRIPAYDTFRDGSGHGAKQDSRVMKRSKRMTKNIVIGILQRAAGQHSVDFAAASIGTALPFIARRWRLGTQSYLPT